MSLSNITDVLPSYDVCPEDLLLNDLLQDKHDFDFCNNCDGSAKSTSRCQDCKESMCDDCLAIHLNVRLGREHRITRITSLAYTTNKLGNLSNNILCDLHLTESVILYCETCCSQVCRLCTLAQHKGHSFVYLKDAIESARKDSMKLITDAKMASQTLKDCMLLYQKMSDTIDLNSHHVSLEISSMIKKMQVALEEREKDLLSKLEKITVTKQFAVQKHVNKLETILQSYTHTIDKLNNALEVGNDLIILQAKDQTFGELRRIRAARGSMPTLNDDISFVKPDPSIVLSVCTIGDVKSSGFLSAIGEGVTRKSPSLSDKSDYSSPLLSPAESMASLKDEEKFKSEHSIALLNKLMMWKTVETPISINLTKPCLRDYRDAGEPRLIIGSEGNDEGQLCRPWGVCCDKKGNIIVADRSNNRVQMFYSDGAFLRSFGSHGSEVGQFDRPAGVATDLLGRIVITDKDNHRVQVFNQEGAFLFKFGERGSGVGQFNYPWDLAIDSKGRIAISDTRNHRIQLFTMDGHFLGKYGFENTPTMIKYFDSPRGVCFGPTDELIVTDFNNHRLVVIEPDFRNAKFLGSEGSCAKQFFRPQGVAVDSSGNIVVADSRNNRIQVIDHQGNFLCQFGSKGSEPGQLDRPSGVCLTPEGKIIVVDFGNNRIQLF